KRARTFASDNSGLSGAKMLLSRYMEVIRYNDNSADRDRFGVGRTKEPKRRCSGTTEQVNAGTREASVRPTVRGTFRQMIPAYLHTCLRRFQAQPIHKMSVGRFNTQHCAASNHGLAEIKRDQHLSSSGTDSISISETTFAQRDERRFKSRPR
ncbi:hypothetical protein, partial [Aporhodopirellula aestuarii]